MLEQEGAAMNSPRGPFDHGDRACTLAMANWFDYVIRRRKTDGSRKSQLDTLTSTRVAKRSCFEPLNDIC